MRNHQVPELTSQPVWSASDISVREQLREGKAYIKTTLTSILLVVLLLLLLLLIIMLIPLNMWHVSCKIAVKVRLNGNYIISDNIKSNDKNIKYTRVINEKRHQIIRNTNYNHQHIQTLTI